jgi:hypothetical protein
MGPAATWRRFVVSISGTNFTVLDSGTNLTVTTALAAATTQTLNLFTLAAGNVILAVKCKPTTAFTGGAVSAATVQIGRASGTDFYLTKFNIFSAAADSGVRRCLQKGAKRFSRTVAGGADTTAATLAVPVAIAATGVEVGDKVLSLQTPASVAGLDLSKFEAVISVADQIQAIASSGDLTAVLVSTEVEKGGGLESDAAAGTAINALFTTLAANVSALTAGSMEIDILIAAAPTIAAGVG